MLLEVAVSINPTAKSDSRIWTEWEQASKESVYPHLQAVARLFLEVEASSRLIALSAIVSRLDDGRHGLGWLDLSSVGKFVELLGDVSSIRCSFASTAMPALHAAFTAKKAGHALSVRFIDPNVEFCELVRLAAVAVNVELEVVAGNPFERADEPAFEAEVCMPPFNLEVRDRSVVSRRTLDRVGASEKVRLHHEPVAMADALVHAPDARVVFSFSAGSLFRTVGVEAAARHELVDSGRLLAVYSVPSRMIYATTMITSAILVLEPGVIRDRAVRLVNLADERFATQAPARRFDVRQEASWAGVLVEELDSGQTWGRDVSLSKIRAQNGVLAVERYLQTRATKALAFYLDGTNTQTIADVVDISRPRAIKKSEEGECVIREALPPDILETGYLTAPSRLTRFARGVLRHARNQQLRPRDVVLSVKGAIGRVGIVPDEAPGPDEDRFWTAAQSFVILRPRGIIVPEVLHEYLTNDLVQEHLASLAGGAAIRTISARDLGTLRVLVPSDEDQARVVKDFRARQRKFAEIERIRCSIREERDGAWPHRLLRPETADEHTGGTTDVSE